MVAAIQPSRKEGRTMKRSLRDLEKSRGSFVFVVALVAVGLAGCGTVSRQAHFVTAMSPESGALVEVGTVTNATGRTPTVDGEAVEVERLLMRKLAEKLNDKQLLWINTPSPHLTLTSKIVEYEPGDAFKRWVLPGWGSTAMTVECELRDQAETVVGRVRIRRTVDAGGLYTVGAWRSIFSTVAGDIVSELKSKISR
jgi:hypothetical protein